MIEKEETIYTIEEDFKEHSEEVKQLFESLEKKDDKDQVQ